jgi:hypothetical protein
MKHLRPTRGALKKLAQRETDPRFYKEFEPITRGPLVAVTILLGAGILALLVTPLRLLNALLRGRRNA